MSRDTGRDIRNALTVLIEQEHLHKQDVEQAMEVAEFVVPASNWRQFLQSLLLWAGAISLAIGAIFFVAANWQYFGRFVKFFLLEVAIVASLIPYFFYPQHPRLRQVCLLTAMLLVGGIMALFGQIYQTGADPWQLFFNWALLTFPWVLISRFHVMWLLFLGLLNMAVLQYFQLFGGYLEETSALFGLNSAALLIWQASASRCDWLNKSWAINLLGAVSGGYATWLFIVHLFDNKFLGVLLWAGWCMTVYFYYRHQNLNVFMLAGLCLSLLVAVNGFVIWLVIDAFEYGIFLLLMLLTIGGGSGSVIWLKKLIKERE